MLNLKPIRNSLTRLEENSVNTNKVLLVLISLLKKVTRYFCWKVTFSKKVTIYLLLSESNALL